MTITPSYIPGPNQTDAVALARATALGIGLAPRIVPPVYATYVTTLPGVIAEYGGGPTVVYHADDGTLTAQQITNAIAGLVAQQAADAVTQANQQTIQTKALAALTANATYLAIAAPTQAQAVAQVNALTQQLDAVIRLLLGQFGSTA